MKSLIAKMYELRALAAKLNGDICLEYSVSTSFMPVAALNMAHNQIVMAIELMTHYAEMFPQPRRGRFEDHLSDHPDETQRILNLFKGCFVSVMSSMESCARKSIQAMPKIWGAGTDKIFLINIVERSRKLGWITVADETVWKGMIDIRNYIVHNNGEAQKFGGFSLPGGIIWLFRPGVQSKVTLRHMPACLEWLIKAYSLWCRAILTKWCAAFDYTPDWNKVYSYEVDSKVASITTHGFDCWSNSGGWSWGNVISQAKEEGERAMVP